MSDITKISPEAIASLGKKCIEVGHGILIVEFEISYGGISGLTEIKREVRERYPVKKMEKLK